MYDKYSKLNTFATNTVLGKHKGILLTQNSTTGSATFEVKNFAGNTFAMGISWTTGSTVFPVQVNKVLALGTGVTGFLLT
jgi:hypothetical protein